MTEMDVVHINRKLQHIHTHMCKCLKYKCHVCLGSYNETAQHAKRQHNGAEESSRATAQESKAGEQGKAAEQGSRVGEQGRAASENQVAIGYRGPNICQKMLTFSLVYEHW